MVGTKTPPARAESRSGDSMISGRFMGAECTRGRFGDKGGRVAGNRLVSDGPIRSAFCDIVEIG